VVFSIFFFFFFSSPILSGRRLDVSYIGSVTARHSSSGRQPNFAAWYKPTRNGITELLQRAPPIFGWAAIPLGVGAHSTLWNIKKRGSELIVNNFIKS